MTISNNKSKLLHSVSEWMIWSFRILLILFLGFIMLIVWKQLDQDGYTLQAFQVPKNFKDAGLTGLVVADRIQDEIYKIKIDANSSKVDSNSLNIADQLDLKMDVMGVGVSTQSLSYHIRNLLGIKPKFIKGELVDIDNTLAITVRMPDIRAFTLEKTYVPGTSKDVLDSLLYEVGYRVLEHIDPYLCGVHSYRNRDMVKAMSLVKSILKDRPNERKWGYLLWANIRRQNKNKEGAMEMCHKALKEDPNFSLPLRNLGWLAIQDEDYDLSISYFERSMIEEPNAFSALNGLAHAYLIQGNTNKAEEYYKKNVDTYPNQFWSYGNYHDFLISEKKDTLAGTKLWEQASKNMQYDANFYVAQAGRYYFQGDSEMAINTMETALELDPQNATALSQLTQANYSETKNYELALDYALKMVEVYKTSDYEKGMQVSALNTLAMCYYMNDLLDEAEVTVRKALKMTDEIGYPWSTLAEVYAFRGDQSSFFKYLKEAYDRGFRYDPSDLKNEPIKSYVNKDRLNRFIEDYRIEEQEALKN